MLPDIHRTSVSPVSPQIGGGCCIELFAGAVRQKYAVNTGQTGGTGLSGTTGLTGTPPSLLPSHIALYCPDYPAGNLTIAWAIDLSAHEYFCLSMNV